MYLTNLSFATYTHILRALLIHKPDFENDAIQDEYNKCISEVCSDLNSARYREDQAKEKEAIRQQALMEAKPNASPE